MENLSKYSFYWPKNYRHNKNSYTKQAIIATIIICLIVFLAAITTNTHAQTLPSGFNQVLVTSGISNPTVMSVAPDGRIFVAQQTGELRIIKNGALLAAPFVSLSVNSSGERGLLGIAFDPAFASNHYIYLYYTLASGANNRISRFTANGDVVVAGSEVVILNLDPLSSATNHNGGTMQFGPDGKLYVGIGENANSANSQNLDTYHGKIIRINSNGTIPTGNPYTSGTTQRRSVWAYGLRNPYTITFQPGTGRLFVNDVGQNTWEEINDATTGGLNFGWPTAEGNSTNTAFTNPVYAYSHGSSIGQGCAITGGTFFNPSSSNYPSTYTGRYFYIDYCGNWMDVLTLSGSTATRANFASNIAGSPVSVVTGADGNIYFLSRSNNSLYKITYSAGQLPVITNQPQNLTVAQGSSATFSVTASGTAPLSYQWRKNGSNISGATASSYTMTNVTSASAGTFSVIVTNGAGSVTSNNATLTVTQPNQAPNASISTPATGATYTAGTSINYSGSATDPEDGALAASVFTWYVLFYHDTHNHPGPTAPDGVTSGSFAIPNTGETSANVFYRLYLVVTDSQGAKDTTYTDILPRTSSITLNTNPQGMQVTLDGQPFTAPYTVTSVEGVLRAIGATSPQTFNGSTYNFSSWSHGGSQTQTIATPVNNVSYTANFATTTTVTLNPVADAYVRGGNNGNINYGTVKTLSTKNASSANGIYETYLRFNISSLATNRTSVKLRLYGRVNNTNTASITAQLYNVTSQTWTENGVTYNTRPVAQTTVLATSTVTGTTNKYYEWDITSHINSLRSAGVTTVSLVLKNAAVTSSRLIFNSKEATSNKPQLVATGSSLREGAGMNDIVSDQDNENTDPFNIKIYPNPATDNVEINYDLFIEKGTLKMFDMSGKLVEDLQITQTNKMILNVNRLPGGIYIISTEVGTKKNTSRLVIKK